MIRDTMPGFGKVGFLTWLNTGGADFNPTKDPAFSARIDDPATFNPPEWDRSAGDGVQMPENKRATMPVEPTRHSPRNLVYTMRFELPQASEELLDHDLRSRGLHAGRGRQGVAVEAAARSTSIRPTSPSSSPAIRSTRISVTCHLP